MIAGPFRVTSLVLLLASAAAGASGARPPVALTASPAHVEISGAGKATVRVTNSGVSRVVVDVSRAGFALDLRGRPKIVGAGSGPWSAASWLSLRPRLLRLRPGATGSVTVASKLPSGVEPGDHDALVLFTTRRRAQGGLAVRMRMGIVVVVRAPGAIVRRVELRRLRVVRRRRGLLLELGVANRGNVTETIARSRALLSLHLRGRRIARLTAEPRELRPRTRGVLQFRYRGHAEGALTAYADVTLESSGGVVRKAFRLRL